MLTDTTLCPMNVEDIHVYGPASCSLSELCSGISCCVTASEIPVNFKIDVEINACREEITIRLEKLKLLIPFRNFTWGMFLLLI